MKNIGDSTDDLVVECSGRKLYAHAGIIGITPSAPGRVYQGYDGVLYWDSDADDEGAFSDEERAEIAEYMIALWTAWRERRR